MPRDRGSGAALAAAMALALALLFAAAGCGGENGDGGEVARYPLEIYYANGAYIAGGLSESRLAGPIKSSLSMSGPDGNPYLALVDEVLREAPPDDLPDGSATMVDDGIGFRGVRVEDGTAYVDISSEGPDGKPLSGGSMEEDLLILQISLSLIDSFDEVKRVQFLVDGEVRESLMGHMDASEPFDRESFEGYGL
ncbi:MAG: GerMN domain-containing protein [Clostridiales Family XIII bacterium]|jgi:subtilisin family serine protease|nr:GerMN domain-containing protein [Clostridiales Family XIII bacterium]